MLKILFVSCLLPYPSVAHGGGTDLFHLIESLSRRHEVHLLSLVDEAESAHIAEMEKCCASVSAVIPAWTWKQKLRGAWRGFWTHPLLIGRRAHGEMRTSIRQTIAKHRVDVVQFEWTETGAFLDAVTPGQVVTVLDEVDVSYRPLEYRAGRYGSPWGRAYAGWRSRRARQRELALCRRFDAVLTRSEHDRQVLMGQLPGARVEVFQPWTHLAEFADIQLADRQKGCLLFVGAMDRDENCEAVLYFYRQVFSRIQSACHQSVELWIAGAHPQPRIVDLGGDPAVKVTGYVPDLRAVYARCDVFVAPMQTPGGVFNKIVDAMAAGRPVVTSSLGNEGVAAAPGLAVRIADEPGSFADHVVALLHNEALWRQVAGRGRDHVRRLYDWQANVARLEALYERWVDRKRSANKGLAL